MTEDVNVSMKAAEVNRPPALSRRKRRQRRCLLNLLLVAVTLVAVNAAVTSLLISWRAPTVVSFDMRRTIDEFTEQAGAQALDEAQSAALTRRFMATLEDELADWQHRHDALILVSPAVVSGAQDITPDVQSAVALKMQEKTP